MERAVIDLQWAMAVPVGFAGAVAQLGERRFCKPEVVGSIPISSIPGVGCPDAPASRAYSPGASGGLTPIPDRDVTAPGRPVFDNLDG